MAPEINLNFIHSTVDNLKRQIIQPVWKYQIGRRFYEQMVVLIFNKLSVKRNAGLLHSLPQKVQVRNLVSWGH